MRAHKDFICPYTTRNGVLMAPCYLRNRIERRQSRLLFNVRRERSPHGTQPDAGDSSRRAGCPAVGSCERLTLTMNVNRSCDILRIPVYSEVSSNSCVLLSSMYYTSLASA